MFTHIWEHMQRIIFVDDRYMWHDSVDVTRQFVDVVFGGQYVARHSIGAALYRHIVARMQDVVIHGNVYSWKGIKEWIIINNAKSPTVEGLG